VPVAPSMPTLSLSAIGLFAVLLGFSDFIANRAESREWTEANRRNPQESSDYL